MGTGPVGSIFAENSFIEKHAGKKEGGRHLVKINSDPGKPTPKSNFRDET